jgi:AcrR family transcriptional regulator
VARPPSITDEQILEAARAVFLERGFSATTQEVAARAGVAAGSVFNRFKTKAELFQAAMLPQLDDPDWLVTLESRVGQGDPRQTLVDVGAQAIGFFRRILPLIMMHWSNPLAQSPLTTPNAPPLRALKRLTRYFEAEIRAGRMRRHDPEIIARSFLGSIVHYVFFEIALAAQQEMPMPAETYVRGLVGVLWQGVEPERNHAPRRRRARRAVDS